MPHRYNEISHFRAPYKDAMFAGADLGGDGRDYIRSAEGYGVYGTVDDSGYDTGEGGGGDEEKLRGMWGQTQWGRQRNPWARGEEGMRAMWGQNPWSGLGEDVDIKTLDPFFNIDGGLTVATDQGAQTLYAMMGQWGTVDKATAASSTPGTTLVIFYHGEATPPADVPVPAGSPNLATILAALLPTVGKAPVVSLMDKRVLVPTPGLRTMVVTSDPKVVAELTRPGGQYFLTKDADPAIVAAAKKAARGSGAKAMGFLTTPVGLAVAVAVLGGGIYLLTRGKKRGRAPSRGGYPALTANRRRRHRRR